MGKIKTINKSLETEKSDTVDSLKDQMNIKSFGAGFFEQLTGSKSSDAHSSEKTSIIEAIAGQIDIFHAVNHKNTEKQKKQAPEKIAKADVRGGIDYYSDIIKSSEKAMHIEMREINKKIQEITAELQRLITSSKILKAEFAEVTVQQAPSQAGEYHINFFEWLLITIRAARQKVEDSGAWLKTVKRKKNKMGYWGMFKKHGTTFGLSNERVVATQTG